LDGWYLPAHFVNDEAVEREGWFGLDTETSGLYIDGGDDSPPARISTVSTGWVLLPDEGDRYDAFSNVTVKKEKIFEDTWVWIASVAWPFDQGGVDKPETHGQISLFEEPNLDERQWGYLLDACLQWQQIYHNAKFDVEKMRVGTRKFTGVDLIDGVLWDTQTGVHLIYPTLGTTSLKPSSRILFGIDAEDEADKLKAYLKKAKLPVGRYDLVPWDIIGPYADYDARLTVMQYLRQQIDIGQIPQDRNTALSPPALYDRRMATTKVLYRMEKRAVPYDEAGSREAGMEGMRRAEKFAAALPFSPTIDRAKKFFFTDARSDRGVPGLNHPAYAVTEKGEPQLTEEIVQRMLADEVPHADTWAQYRKVTNAVGMWYFGYANKVGQDGRLRTCFRQNGTRSSRFSVERVNLQAIPQDYRLEGYEALAGLPTPRQLIASAVPPGWRMWELDLEQAELRVGALYARCERMLEMINRGVDLHNYTTQELFDIEQGSPKWPMMRQVGKRGNFSLLFGSGPPTFRKMVAKECGIMLSDMESTRVVRGWNRLYPEFSQVIDFTSRKVQRRQRKFGHGWVQFQNGERRYFLPDEDTHKAFNQRVQGNLAQFGIDWMLRTDEFLREAGLDDTEIGPAGLVLTIHDSQVLLLPDTAWGDSLAMQCSAFANELWGQVFPGVPGGSSPKKW